MDLLIKPKKILNMMMAHEDRIEMKFKINPAL